MGNGCCEQYFRGGIRLSLDRRRTDLGRFSRSSNFLDLNIQCYIH